jgi:hypothetical protein
MSWPCAPSLSPSRCRPCRRSNIRRRCSRARRGACSARHRGGWPRWCSARWRRAPSRAHRAGNDGSGRASAQSRPSARTAIHRRRRGRARRRDRTCRSCDRDIAGSRRIRRPRSACRPALGIDDRRHAVVGRDRQEFRLELVALADVHGNDGVGQPALLEHDGDLPAVGRRPVIQIDRLGLAGGHGGGFLSRFLHAVEIARHLDLGIRHRASRKETRHSRGFPSGICSLAGLSPCREGRSARAG